MNRNSEKLCPKSCSSNNKFVKMECFGVLFCFPWRVTLRCSMFDSSNISWHFLNLNINEWTLLTFRVHVYFYLIIPVNFYKRKSIFQMIQTKGHPLFSLIKLSRLLVKYSELHMCGKSGSLVVGITCFSSNIAYRSLTNKVYAAYFKHLNIHC